MPFTSHAADRAAERYGLKPTEADWAQAVLDIIDTVAGDRIAAVLLRTFADGVERWLVRICEREVIVVYVPDQALVITVVQPNHPYEYYPNAPKGRSGAGRPVERRRGGRWRFTSDEHIA